MSDRPAGPKSLRRFLRSTEAGATAITAAVIALMTVMGSGFIVDRLWIVRPHRAGD